MAGHSQFKNIMYRKGAQDAKRAKVFGKIIRELTVAARSNSDPEGNPNLRGAIAAARAANMPKDTMERAIKRGSGGEDGAALEEIRYEGYGPGGVAVIIEALTDNRNRSAGEIRAAFGKYGGSLGETGSVSFMFEHVGQVLFAAGQADPDAMFEAALVAGADDCRSDEDGHEVICAPTSFHAVRESLTDAFGDPIEASLVWRPQSAIEVADDKAETLLKLLDVLDDNDDVQRVFANFEISDDVLARLGG